LSGFPSSHMTGASTSMHDICTQLVDAAIASRAVQTYRITSPSAVEGTITPAPRAAPSSPAPRSTMESPRTEPPRPISVAYWNGRAGVTLWLSEMPNDQSEARAMMAG
jgi:hypothetical protein